MINLQVESRIKLINGEVFAVKEVEGGFDLVSENTKESVGFTFRSLKNILGSLRIAEVDGTIISFGVPVVDLDGNKEFHEVPCYNWFINTFEEAVAHTEKSLNKYWKVDYEALRKGI